MRFDQRVFAWAQKQLGKPYIWKGHGELCWSPTAPISTMALAGCQEGFDCAGLVTCAVLAAGGPDLRWTWNAETMWHNLPVEGTDEPWDAHRLVFYGRPDHVSHVAIDVGHGNVLEAAGGDQTTTTLQAALARPHAYVDNHPETRTDRLGYRSLLAMERITGKIPVVRSNNI